MGIQWKLWETWAIFLGSKITAGGDCNHEIKRHLLLGRKAMTNLDNILKSRGINLPTKVHLVKAMVFPVVMYGWESWTIKKLSAEELMLFELWCWRRLMRVPWTARRSNWSILKEISPEYSLEGLMLKLKKAQTPILCLPDAKNWLIWKDPDAGQDWRQEKGTTKDKMFGWLHQLYGHEFEQAPGGGEGQGSLACCSSWGHKESDTTEWTETDSLILNAYPTYVHTHMHLRRDYSFKRWSTVWVLLLYICRSQNWAGLREKWLLLCLEIYRPQLYKKLCKISLRYVLPVCFFSVSLAPVFIRPAYHCCQGNLPLVHV